MNALPPLDFGTVAGIAVMILVVAGIGLSLLIDHQRRGGIATTPPGPALPSDPPRSANAGAVIVGQLEAARKAAIVAEIDRRISAPPEVSEDVDKIVATIGGKAKATEAPKAE